jgi:glyoxalase family protein
MPSVHGIHHVTAIAGDAQENLDFYVGVLGLRLVKRSVNQDAPDTYHFFYADADGTPGTDLTFFPWPAMPPARLGVGLSVEVAFSVAPASLAYWQERLDRHGVRVDALEERFGETVLPFVDPHGLRLALVATAAPIATTPWVQSTVSAEHQLQGMHSVRLWEGRLAPTAAHLTGVLGFQELGEENGWHRFGVDGGGAGKVVDVKELPGERRGAWGVGGIHHVRGGWPIRRKRWRCAPRLRRRVCSPRRRSTASGSNRSTSRSRAACSLNWPPTGQASTATRILRGWASS